MPKAKKYAVVARFRSGWVTNVGTMVQQEQYSRGQLVMDESWSNVANVELFPLGVAAKRSGATKLASTFSTGAGSLLTYSYMGAPTPIGLLYYHVRAAGTSDLVAYFHKSSGTSANLAKYSGTGKTWTHFGGSATKDWAGDIEDKVFAETFADRLVVSNGEDTACQWTGSGSAVAMASTCYPFKCMKAFKDYLFIGNTLESGAQQTGRVRWSKQGQAWLASDWPAANFMDLDPDDGDKIVGMEVLGNSLIVFKEHRIYAIDYIGGPWVFDWRVLIEGRGCVSGLSIVPLKKSLVFLSEDGFYALTGNNIEELSHKIKDQILDINATYFHHVKGVHYPDKDQILFTIPNAGSERISAGSSSASKPNNEVWIFDYVNGAWWRHDLQLHTLGTWYADTDRTFADMPDSFISYTIAFGDREGQSGTPQLVGGDYRGHAHQLDDGASDASTISPGSSEAVDGWWETRWFDFGDPINTKRLTRMTFMIEPQGPTSNFYMDITAYTDWNPSASTTFTFDASGGTNIPVLERRVDWTKQFRSLKLRIRADSDNEPFKVHKITFEYIKKGKTGGDTYG